MLKLLKPKRGENMRENIEEERKTKPGTSTLLQNLLGYI